MPDYKEMYLTLFRATEQAINLLIAAQQTCEDMYVNASEDSRMQLSLFYRGRGVAIFRPEFQPGDTPPDDLLFSVPGPSHPLVGSTAFPADQQLGQSIFIGIFALFRFSCLLHHLSLTGPARHLRLYRLVDLPRDDGRMIVLDVVHGALPLILLNPLADTVCHISLLQKYISDVPLIGEDVLDHLVGPSMDALGCGDLVFLQLLLDLPQAAPV